MKSFNFTQSTENQGLRRGAPEKVDGLPTMADLRVKRGKAKPRTNLHTRVAVPADRIAALTSAVATTPVSAATTMPATATILVGSVAPSSQGRDICTGCVSPG